MGSDRIWHEIPVRDQQTLACSAAALSHTRHSFRRLREAGMELGTNGPAKKSATKKARRKAGLETFATPGGLAQNASLMPTKVSMTARQGRRTCSGTRPVIWLPR